MASYWLSFSAPQVCRADEARDLAEINECERLEIYQDKYGLRPSGVGSDGDGIAEMVGHGGEDDDMSVELINTFFVEIGKIPIEKKMEYMEALIKASDLVRNESSPTGFLRYCNYDPAKAAAALCRYWKKRVEIFEDDAFKPMTLTGACKSIVKDISEHPTLIRILPEDDSGRTVFCADRSNVNYAECNDQIVFIKYFWFVYHRSLRTTNIQKNGVVYIIINRGTSFLGRSTLKNAYNHCLPIKLCCAHFCLSSLAARIMLPTIKFFLSKENRRRVELHSSMKNPTILEELSEFGMQKRNLPSSIGGTYATKNAWVIECEQLLDNSRRSSRGITNSRHYERRSSF